MKKIEEKTIIGRVPTIEEHEAAAKETTTAEVKAPTLDDMQKKIALQQEHLNRLNGFFADRARFSKTRDDLKRFKSSIDAAIKSGCIESPQHRMFFAENDNYRVEALISVSAPEIIQEFLEFIDEKIKNKLQQLDANIVAMAA